MYNILIFPLSRIVLYCKNKYCNISIYCNIVSSLVGTYILIYLALIMPISYPIWLLQNKQTILAACRSYDTVLSLTNVI